MNRLIVGLCAFTLVACGCQDGKMTMPWSKKKAHVAMHDEKPGQPAEMKRLENMVGSWDDTAEMSAATIAEMKKHQAEGAPPMQTTFKGEHKTEYVLDGKAIRSEGWYEMGEGKKANYMECVMWSPSEGKYLTWFMNDWCEGGSGWMTSDEAGTRFTGGAKSSTSKMTSSTTVVDNNNIRWSMSEKGAKGNFELSGSSKRK